VTKSTRLGRLGGVQPIGSQVATVNVAGQNWELWDGYNGSMHVFSFVAQNQLSSFSADVKVFLTWLASNRGFPASSQYLLSK
jgi:xyloglucan-specific endo-beta-1,4-glucanase